MQLAIGLNSFIFIQLNVKTVQFQTIQFSLPKVFYCLYTVKRSYSSISNDSV